MVIFDELTKPNGLLSYLCGMIKFMLELLALYLLYQFIVELVIPIYHTTRQVKQKMQDFQQQMHRATGSSEAKTPGKEEPANKAHQEDYIEFEEIK